MAALEDALLSAYKKTPRRPSTRASRWTATAATSASRADPAARARGAAARRGRGGAERADRSTPRRASARAAGAAEIDPERLAQYRDQIEERDVTPDDFGRIAAQTAKQVILQRIREAERDMMYEEYQDRVGELITGIVQQSDSRYTLVQLRERVEALLPKSRAGRTTSATTTASASRRSSPTSRTRPRGRASSSRAARPELIRKLFELEVPEIADGLVEIQNVAREPGYRSKIAVVSHADGVDPVGACVGPRGSRVRMVVSELRGEKIDIIPFNEEPARFVAKALSPARVREVLVDDEAKQATVIVPDDQLSLAIGKEGLNARLAARLTGWRIDIRSETEFAEEEAEMGYEEEEVAGRCAAILANGKRCPNAVAARLALLRPARAPGARAAPGGRPGRGAEPARRGDGADEPAEEPVVEERAREAVEETVRPSRGRSADETEDAARPRPRRSRRPREERRDRGGDSGRSGRTATLRRLPALTAEAELLTPLVPAARRRAMSDDPDAIADGAPTSVPS